MKPLENCLANVWGNVCAIYVHLIKSFDHCSSFLSVGMSFCTWGSIVSVSQHRLVGRFPFCHHCWLNRCVVDFSWVRERPLTMVIGRQQGRRGQAEYCAWMSPMHMSWDGRTITRAQQRQPWIFLQLCTSTTFFCNVFHDVDDTNLAASSITSPQLHLITFDIFPTGG